ncbi:MAG: aspartate--ammonia ligase [Fastidiosipilaceae bacterium]|jgi:aspartate--ammonia ligase
MNHSVIPAGYESALDLYETQLAIGLIKNTFQQNLSDALNLKRVSAPLFVDPTSGLNDNLSGVERPVSFDIPATGGDGEVVHSLAKWKRLALYRYGFHLGEGIYTDMNAIRRDEVLDNIHSIYVDQWDWEKAIGRADRTIDYLKQTVQDIVDCIYQSSFMVRWKFHQIPVVVDRNIAFITTQELEDLYPSLTPKEREHRFVKEHHTTFLLQIGGKLRSGQPHDRRAPDYDDWRLNGDLLMYNPILDEALELSSMGIRVDGEALDHQLNLADCNDRRKLPFHQMLLEDILPLSIGGGIGQSRLCMLLLGKAHIGEVQSSLWDQETINLCQENQVRLL